MHQSRSEKFFSLHLPQFSYQRDFATFFASPGYFLQFDKLQEISNKLQVSADTRNDALVYVCHNQFGKLSMASIS